MIQGSTEKSRYWIRLENMILVLKDRKSEFGRLVLFDNMTLCRFETSVDDRYLLRHE